MKQRFASVLILLLFQMQVFAQDNYVYYSKAISAKGFEKMKFRFTAFVRTDGEEDDAAARLWVGMRRANGETKMSGNMEDVPIRTPDWKQFSLEGVIDPGTERVVFGMLLQYNGKFYFDDLELAVQTKKNKWVTIYQDGFEGPSHDLKQIDPVRGSVSNQNFTAVISKDVKRSGAQALLITGHDVPNFGVNSNVGKYAEVNGIKLYYEIYGTGAPLLVLHGNGGSISSAAPHYPALMEQYKVIAVDSRGQGKSTDTDAPLTYEQLAADINSLLDKLHMDSVFIWGHSDGAILGLILAMDYPAKVKRLLAYGANLEPDSSAIFSWAVNGLEKARDQEKDIKQKKLIDLMLDNPHIPFQKLSKIQVPVLVMAGDRDIITPEHTLGIFRHIPKSQLCILAGATHNGSWDQRLLFLQYLNDFFQKPFAKPDTKDWFK